MTSTSPYIPAHDEDIPWGFDWTPEFSRRARHPLGVVVLNQVLVRFDDSDEATEAVIERVQRDGTCWLGGSSFRGRAVMRISIVGWQTTAGDVDRSAEAILRAAGPAA